MFSFKGVKPSQTKCVSPSPCSWICKICSTEAQVVVVAIPLGLFTQRVTADPSGKTYPDITQPVPDFPEMSLDRQIPKGFPTTVRGSFGSGGLLSSGMLAFHSVTRPA